jgi:hypothetical protein
MSRSKAVPGPLRLVAFLVVVSLAVGSPGGAYAQGVQAVAQNAPHMLTINILEGEGALNNIRQRDAREPIVQVTDENHKPVAGVALLFLIHGEGGATANFNGSTSFSVISNQEGIARAVGMRLGRKPGQITISVTATVGAFVVASAIIHQSNVLKLAKGSTQNSAGQSAGNGGGAGSGAAGGAANGAGGEGSAGQAGSAGVSAPVKHGIFHLSKTTLIAGAAVVAAAAVVGIVLATKGNGATSLTLGTGTVGHP